MIRCLRCFEEYPDIFGVCPVCGNSVGCLSADPERLKPGCLLHGRYIVGYGVGRGGFGSVYRGYDKLTGTVTAIKELFVPSLVERSRDGITVGLRSSRFAPAWKAGIRRFFGEAEAEMSAPASVGCAVYDCFEENGTAYLVMEYLGGLSLAGKISSGGCGLPEKIDLIVKTALAVSALHCSGRVHLDIAPDNVMAVGDGHSREIRLIDFGSSGEGHRLPFTAERVFKEGYSSPELVFGKDPSDDPESGVKSDVYSLGATAYMLLTGKRPPAAGDREGARLIPPHEVDAAVPAAVSLAVVKAMSCDPGRRFQSAAEFARAVSAGACLAPVTGKEIKKGKKKSGQGVALTRQAYAAVGEKSPDPLRFFREVRDMPPADFPVCDRSFSAGVSEPLPERLLPGTRAGREVNRANPIVDTRLPDGSRVNVVLPPVSLSGASMTIRRFPSGQMTVGRLIELGSLTSDAAGFLELLVRARYNLFISGGTGSGKTTFLGALTGFIPPDERIITIEDSAELRLSGIENLVSLEVRNANSAGAGRVTVSDLIKSSLRMRPERIIVGEVRGAEALDMLQAMNTGHDGSISTGHANSTRDMLGRLETMVIQGGSGLPSEAVRRQIASAIDIVVHLSRMRDRSRRTVEISEVTDFCPESGEIGIRKIFEFVEDGADGGKENDSVKGSLRRTGAGLKNCGKLKLAGLYGKYVSVFGEEGSDEDR